MKFFCFAFLHPQRGGERFESMGGATSRAIGYGFMVDEDLPGMNYDITGCGNNDPN